MITNIIKYVVNNESKAIKIMRVCCMIAMIIIPMLLAYISKTNVYFVVILANLIWDITQYLFDKIFEKK